jgi:hypothetical protein
VVTLQFAKLVSGVLVEAIAPSDVAARHIDAEGQAKARGGLRV